MAATGTHARNTPPEIPGYLVGEELGRGGMGLVYHAVQERLHRQVAIKILRVDLCDDQESEERFQREADAVARICHQNVIPIYDFGNVDGRLYMVFPYLGEGDIIDWLDRHGAMSERKALQVIRGCLEGVMAIDRAGMVHRDIKPTNIFFDDGRPVIGDFGLVRAAGGTSGLTREGSSVGTPAYMAPEQIRDASRVDIRADLYAIGASLYTMVTNRVPYDGDSPYTISHQVLSDAPSPDPRALVPQLSEAMVAIIRTATAKDVDQRYQTPQAMLHDVNAALAGRPLHHALGTGGGAIGPGIRRRQRLLVALMAIVIATLMLILGAWLTQRRPPYHPPWADRVGQDHLGYWASLRIGPHLVRFRYIRVPQDHVVRIGSSADEAGFQAHELRREVALASDFWMADVECSQALWQHMTQSNPSHYLDPDKPVDNLTREQVVLGIGKLNALVPALHARLPSEAEWEFACRAGSDAAFGALPETTSADWPRTAVMAPENLANAWRAWQAGEVAEPIVWQAADALPHAGPRAVRGDRPPNAWGLYDMHGNIGEWCLDAFAADDPRGVVRSGSWWHPPERCRSAARRGQDPTQGDVRTGFRLLVPAM